MFSQQQHIFTGFSIHHHNLSTSIYFTICLHCIYDYSTSMNLLLVDRFQKVFFMKVARYVEEEWWSFLFLYMVVYGAYEIKLLFRKIVFIFGGFFFLSCLALLLPCSFFQLFFLSIVLLFELFNGHSTFFFAGERIYEWWRLRWVETFGRWIFYVHMVHIYDSISFFFCAFFLR